VCFLVISCTIIDSIAAHGLAPVVTTKEKDGESEAPAIRTTRQHLLEFLVRAGVVRALEPASLQEVYPGCFFCCDRSRAVTFRFGCVK
jgi:hypothetical protein